MIREEVKIPLQEVTLSGNLVVPENAIALVIFSHGSGSSRFSPRNNLVAEQLQKRGIATLLFDLLTKYEDAVYENRFDIDMLTERLIAATQWVKQQEHLKKLPMGYFGASTGAASALMAASKLGKGIQAIVSRGGRPDLALPFLDKVKAPTLLIVGALDTPVIEYNEQALKQLTAVSELKIVAGATHLFEERGKLEEVAEMAAAWFEKHL
ncbi:dienelactone hydrolase [Fulvivirga imtechensis AK7]|uniref:Dienelactone hydrolase n=2 Tax=Fulvivirga TaxID=396811 RepID=L8JVF0_9BACT|nr:dienelactone hydrolase [Fulvivirga imtechensis AK7]